MAAALAGTGGVAGPARSGGSGRWSLSSWGWGLLAGRLFGVAWA
jgi:hypothetical protein